ncbi:MAG: UDP-N-acetylmuramoyl-L-alanine--D-glutamate ligase [Bdellovibrionota bacterium]
MTDSTRFQVLRAEVGKAVRDAATFPVLVAGGGITGRAATRTFLDAGFRVWVVDEKALSENHQKEIAEAQLVQSFKGTADLPKDFPQRFAFVLTSPGIHPKAPFSRWLQSLGAPLFSELDLSFPFLGMPDVAVTGTNGKTTVVTLIAAMLRASGIEAELVGNVGYPFLSKLTPEELRAGPPAAPERLICWVAELSSYQLETVRVISPRVSVLLNIDDDHLERHGSLEAYLAAKLRIFEDQDPESGIAILNRDEAWSGSSKTSCTGRVTWFGTEHSTEQHRSMDHGCFYDPEKKQLIFRSPAGEEGYSLENTKLLGAHNKLNLAASVAAARGAGGTPDGIQSVIDSFTPLEHRVEHVACVGGVHFVNDSKGTNVSSVRVALDTIASEFSPGKVVLLVGGKMKEGAWDSVRERLPKLARSVIGFGADGGLVLEQLGLEVGAAGAISVQRIDTLEHALRAAKATASPGDVVLLSPGCASFDAYSDFGARGRHFKQLVHSL